MSTSTAALDLDPAFASAAGALALCHTTFALYGLEAPADVMPIARAAADRALAVDPAEPAARSARAAIRAVHDWDPAGAERDFRRVIALSPSNATAHQWFATNLLAPQGRFDEARAVLARARELDPLSASVMVSRRIRGVLGWRSAGRHRALRTGASLDPAFNGARFFLGPMLMAAGREREAIDMLEHAAAATARSPEVLAALATVCAAAGHRARAEAVLAELVAAGPSRFVSPGLTSMVRAALGDLDGAVADMARAIDMRAVEVVWLQVRPAYAALRAAPQYVTLLARRDAARRLAPPTGH